jgi:hypothetical protein
MRRVLVGIALCGAFLVMASVFVPIDTGAGPLVPKPGSNAQPAHPAPESYSPPNDPQSHHYGHSTDPHENLHSIGSLEDGCYIVFIYATDHGPRYTIHDHKERRDLATLITAERVQELFPELPLPDIDFSGPDSPVQMMLAPTNSGMY